MNKMSLNLRSMSVTLKRLIMTMAAIMMALVTFTACDDENGKDDPDENGNGGGVAGKRLKSSISINASSGETQRGEFTYNNDGSLKRSDWYDTSSKHYLYINYTNNSDGTISKQESFYTDIDMTQILDFTYDANKKLKKAEGNIRIVSEIIPLVMEYTFQNGRLIRQIIKSGNPGGNGYGEIKYEQNYDASGRRTTTTETHNLMGTRIYTRTYNSDGTLQKVSTDGYAGSTNTGFTITYTWENEKTTSNFDDYEPF
jgi:hypothetical protein